MLINTAFLNKLFKEDKEYALEIIDLFVKLIPEYIEKLKKNYAYETRDDFKKLIHQILTSFKLLGNEEVSEKLREFEKKLFSKINSSDTESSFYSFLDEISELVKHFEIALKEFKQENKD